ncbi:uncharacterized protein SPPG_00487 [Spizellomyces punctatus DAOM BR117]|uniref:Uncharacterized protein n=1 Tax=Spizellomyces punctatus (strain DAOM BR117) TaxID=645134 RepID=A0A0L0HUJ1_SPIPD|nr:uncharacterized protein SPPG_00487 [Spizellomyces punctatus DAOM BR117]KND04783.1 hypothetical protein SPPG_00487 [Spizellomyces punctatus DAOM BR117]|eukprot:XP_016612822.1 hypothetical protein SPPG_00487 [Spizellomyces punctatus DAOM BR117]
MDQETANALFDKGAVLLFLDAPQNMEFGVDCYSWTTGPKFKGLKLIPPGIHFVYYSALSRHGEGSVRTGFFKTFAEREVVVKRWNPSAEDLYADDEIDQEDAERYRSNVRDFDRFLGVYPLLPVDNDPVSPYQKWLRLTTHITPQLIDRILPPSRKISAMTTVSRFSDVDDVRQCKPSGEVVMNEDQSEHDANTVAAQGGEDVIRGERVEVLRLNFTPIDLKRSFPSGASGGDVTKYSMDKSYLLRQLLQNQYKDYKELLGELQLAFIIFLLGEVYDGYEQWKTFIHLLCQSDEAIDDNGSTLFYEFIGIFHAQLESHPTDFFYDALSADNFIRSNILIFVRMLQDRAGRGVPKTLQSAVDTLVDFVESRFKWDIRHDVRVLGEEEEEEGEFAPVVVEM